jgi:hypothetical protein
LRSAVLLALLGYVLASRELLLLAGLLATVYAIAAGLNHGALDAVRYARSLQPRRAFAGEPIACMGKMALPLWLAADRWPNAVARTPARSAPSHLAE